MGSLNNKTTHVVGRDRVDGQTNMREGRKRREAQKDKGGVVERACLCQKMRQAMR